VVPPVVVIIVFKYTPEAKQLFLSTIAAKPLAATKVSTTVAINNLWISVRIIVVHLSSQIKSSPERALFAVLFTPGSLESYHGIWANWKGFFGADSENSTRSSSPSGGCRYKPGFGLDFRK